MSFNFVTVALVEAIHAELIREYGGSEGLRDRGLLESAVARAENLAYYRPDASVAEVGATLAWGLVKNHAFIDGNKRIGFAMLDVFLGENGHRLICSEAEETAAILQMAAGEMSEGEWSLWVEENTDRTR